MEIFMNYSSEAYDKAEKLLASYRRTANDKILSRTEEIYKKIPEIKDIDEKIRAIGVDVSRLSLKCGISPDDAYLRLSTDISILEKKKEHLLEENGYPHDYVTNVHHCPVCKDTGYVNDTTCNCMVKLLSSIDSGLPSYHRFADFHLDVYSAEHSERYGCSPREHMKNVLAYCKSYVTKFPDNVANILMYGSAGLGKTFLCDCIRTELVDRGFTVVYKSAYDLFELVSKNKFNYKINLNSEIETLYTCDLLIMDDLGTEFLTEYTVSSLFDIVNSRMNAGKPMIVNANLSPKDMEKRYSDRIISRLLTFKLLLFFGADIRTASLL
ncbi:MAG: ATP-binding protein [Bacillota bacterium]|nr:ATP-binding protein [Bacillota bacterium]